MDEERGAAVYAGYCGSAVCQETSSIAMSLGESLCIALNGLHCEAPVVVLVVVVLSQWWGPSVIHLDAMGALWRMDGNLSVDGEHCTLGHTGAEPMFVGVLYGFIIAEWLCIQLGFLVKAKICSTGEHISVFRSECFFGAVKWVLCG